MWKVPDFLPQALSRYYGQVAQLNHPCFIKAIIESMQSAKNENDIKDNIIFIILFEEDVRVVNMVKRTNANITERTINKPRVNTYSSGL